MENSKFVYLIEDDFHAEVHAEFDSMQSAMDELHRMSEVPFGRAPNMPPCGNSGCHRDWHVIEYNAGTEPWSEAKSLRIAESSDSGWRWVKQA